MAAILSRPQCVNNVVATNRARFLKHKQRSSPRIIWISSQNACHVLECSPTPSPSILVTTGTRIKGVWNRRQLDCLLNNVFRQTTDKATKHRIILCVGNPPAINGFPHKGRVMRKAFPRHDAFRIRPVEYFSRMLRMEILVCTVSPKPFQTGRHFFSPHLRRIIHLNQVTNWRENKRKHCQRWQNELIVCVVIALIASRIVH